MNCKLRAEHWKLRQSAAHVAQCSLNFRAPLPFTNCASGRPLAAEKEKETDQKRKREREKLTARRERERERERDPLLRLVPNLS